MSQLFFFDALALRAFVMFQRSPLRPKALAAAYAFAGILYTEILQGLQSYQKSFGYKYPIARHPPQPLPTNVTWVYSDPWKAFSARSPLNHIEDHGPISALQITPYQTFTPRSPPTIFDSDWFSRYILYVFAVIGIWSLSAIVLNLVRPQVTVVEEPVVEVEEVANEVVEYDEVVIETSRNDEPTPAPLSVEHTTRKSLFSRLLSPFFNSRLPSILGPRPLFTAKRRSRRSYGKPDKPYGQCRFVAGRRHNQVLRRTNQ